MIGCPRKRVNPTAGYEQRTLDTIREEYNTRPLTQEEIHGRSQRSMLHVIAERNNAWIVVQPAIRMMIEAGILTEDSASAQVYTLLRNDAEFQYVAPGIYRSRGEASEDESAASEVQTETNSVRLSDRVVSILREHPIWDRKRVHRELTKQGFTFGQSAVNFAYNHAEKLLASQKRSQEVLHLPQVG